MTREKCNNGISRYGCAVLVCGAGLVIYAASGNANPSPQQDQRSQSQDQQRSVSSQAREIGLAAPPSSLIEENLAQVAASADEIRAVLQKDSGLLVELKRWVAIDDTNHGKVVDENELTDGAVYERLTKDQVFRGVATRLLQRYGYLTPKYSPGSEAEVNQQLLRQAEWNRVQRASQPGASATRTAQRSVSTGATQNEEQLRPSDSNAGVTDGDDSLPPDSLTPPNFLEPQLPSNIPGTVPGFIRTSANDMSQQTAASTEMMGVSTEDTGIGGFKVSGDLGTGIDAKRTQMTRGKLLGTFEVTSQQSQISRRFLAAFFERCRKVQMTREVL